MSDARSNALEKAVFRCDDRTGFEFRIIQAQDGDFYLALHPNRDDMLQELGIDIAKTDEGDEYKAMYGAGIRVRMPMIGGGDHPELWHALAKLFKALRKAKKLGEVPR